MERGNGQAQDDREDEGSYEASAHFHEVLSSVCLGRKPRRAFAKKDEDIVQKVECRYTHRDLVSKEIAKQE